MIRCLRLRRVPALGALVIAVLIASSGEAWAEVRSDGVAASPRLERHFSWAQVAAAAPTQQAYTRTVAHAKGAHDRFHVTALRFWLYQEFLPKSDDAEALGIELNSAWGWGRLDFSNISYIEVVDYARAVPGMPVGNGVPALGAASGVTDLLSATLVSPKRAHHGPHHFAAGIAVQLPTASDDTIGTGKWSMGPAIEYEYHKGRLFAAFVALQLWSFAGDTDRKRVNMMMIKPMVTYDLGKRWKAVYMPYGISVYWDKPSGDQVYLPIGGGVQRGFRLGRQELAASLQFFHYVLRPAKGAEYDLRLMVELDF